MRREQPVQNNELNPEDLELAKEFLDEYTTLQNLSKGSVVKYRCSLWAFLAEIHKQGHNLPNLDNQACLGLIKYLQTGTNWSEDTKEDYWKRWCKFYGWAADKYGEAWRAEPKKLFADKDKRYRYRKDKNLVVKKGILTPEEALQLVHVEMSIPWQVFWAVLYESGMRAGEAFALRLENVKPLNGRGYVLELPKSKTERRTIPLIHFSKDYLAKWLQVHPDKANPSAYLFVNTQGKQLYDETANKRLRQLLSAAGIHKKKISLHSFRHSRATELCHILTEAQLCALFGWTMGSTMPRTYIRAEQIDVTNSLLRGYGLQEQEHHEIKGRVCLSCSHLNSFVAEWCDVCKLPLDPQKLQTVKDATNSQALMEKMARELKGDLITEMAKMIKAGGNP